MFGTVSEAVEISVDLNSKVVVTDLIGDQTQSKVLFKLVVAERAVTMKDLVLVGIVAVLVDVSVIHEHRVTTVTKKLVKVDTINGVGKLIEQILTDEPL